MLTPLSEADDQGPFFQLSRASHAMYDGIIRDLEAETKVDCGYSKEGLLALASSEVSAKTLRCRFEWQKKAGFDVELLSADEVRRLEPLITVPIAAAVFLPGDRLVTPRRLVNALRESCFSRGVEMRLGVHVEEVGPHAARVGRLTIEAESIVIASGVWSGEMKGLNPPIPVYPRKGQILSLSMPPGAFRHMIRWGSTYFAPRPDGELVVGATNESAGFDLSNTPAGLGSLLNEAQEISAHADQFPIIETWAGLRPATPDGLPIIGPSAVPGVYYATGHYRNGVLLAPITAAILRDLIEDGKTSYAIEPYSPSRFSTQA